MDTKQIKIEILRFYAQGNDIAPLRRSIYATHGEEAISKPYLGVLIGELVGDGLLASNKNATRPIYRTSPAGRDWVCAVGSNL